MLSISGNEYELRGNIVGKSIPLNINQSFRGNVEMVEIKFKIDDYNGYGLMFTG